MSGEQERAWQDGWRVMQDNPFWQAFWGELLRKRDYLLARLAEVGSWEECCRIQGELAACRRLILWAERMGKGEQE